MGMEIQVNSLEEMCSLMCDNTIPKRRKGMTREEAKGRLLDIQNRLNMTFRTVQEQEEYTALEMAIKTLEQKPCFDSVSVEAVIEWLKDKDIIKLKSQEENARKELQQVYSVKPQEPKTGHWIPSHITESILDECSECGFSCGAFTFNYCPNCGCRMESEG